MINMERRVGLLVVVAVATGFALSCGDDDTTTPSPPNTSSNFHNLTTKENVLGNFELAHNKRDTSHYDALLDDNFTFFYTEGDAGGGGTPVQWGRTDDITTTHAMFASVDDLDFTLDDSNVQWTVIPAGSESWYQTTLFYHFTVKIGNYTYIPNSGAKMTLTVRNAGTEEAPQWKLVELRDLGGPSVLNAVAALTEATTYGQVKALFKPSGFKNLTEKADVLDNFERAHNERDTSHYDALLDDNFTFFYTEADVGGAGTPVQWGRTDDITATHGLFAAASTIDMDVVREGGVTWIEVNPGSETWYSTTVYYTFVIHIGDTTYLTNAGTKMQFTIRNAGTDMAPQWRLVQLRDLGGPSLQAQATSAAETQPTTYGQVKSLFR
jgi:hypothetical protein